MKKLYGSLLLFLYFLKIPMLIGLPMMYYIGLKDNYILDIVWLMMLALVIKDIAVIIQKKFKK